MSPFDHSLKSKDDAAAGQHALREDTKIDEFTSLMAALEIGRAKMNVEDLEDAGVKLVPGSPRSR